MKFTRVAIFLTAVYLTGCANSMEHAFYNGIQNQNEYFKTHDERAMNPSPSYNNYRKERESLTKKVPADENKQTTTINDK